MDTKEKNKMTIEGSREEHVVSPPLTAVPGTPGSPGAPAGPRSP